MQQSKKLAKELAEYKKMKDRVTADYQKFVDASQEDKLKMVKDKNLFVQCAPDVDGKIRVIFFPDYFYEWYLDTSIEFMESRQKGMDPVYDRFLEVFKIRRGN
jgi:hypothetical protein